MALNLKNVVKVMAICLGTMYAANKIPMVKSLIG